MSENTLTQKILGDAAPGYSSGEALAAMEAAAREALPEGYALEWTGTSYQEKVAGGSSTSRSASSTRR
mgnify:CR=1 FL=1